MKRLLALILAVAMVLALAACGSETDTKNVEDAEETSASSTVTDSTEATGETEAVEVSEETAAKLGVSTIAEAKEVNPDVVGWLKFPNTEIDEPVVFYANDVNEYYLRRDWKGKEDYNGCYFGDYRGVYTSRAALCNNTIIYGHSMDDNADGGRFSQLKKLKDQTFAQNNPCIYFSTSDGDTMVWQIFAAFVTTTTLSYNNPEINGKQVAKLASSCKKNSIYTYDVEVTENDKILTLSTCVYSYNGKSLGYPNDYRFVVMAKLLPAGTAAPKTASIVANKNAKQ